MTTDKSTPTQPQFTGIGPEAPVSKAVVTHPYERLGELDGPIEHFREVFLSGVRALELPRSVRRYFLLSRNLTHGFIYVIGHPNPNEASVYVKQFTTVPTEIDLKQLVPIYVVMALKPDKVAGGYQSYWSSIPRKRLRELFLSLE